MHILIIEINLEIVANYRNVLIYMVYIIILILLKSI